MPLRRRRKLFEDGLMLRIGPLRRAGLLRLGSTVEKSLRIRYGIATAFDIDAVSSLDGDGNGRLDIRVHPVSVCGRSPARSFTATFDITGRPSPWRKGVFVSFVCPSTQRPCRTLYMPPGASRWGCYASWPRTEYAHGAENASRFRRLVARSRKLRCRLSVDCDWLAPLPARPAGMPASRYRDIVAAIDAVEAGPLRELSQLTAKAPWVQDDREPSTGPLG